MDGMRKSLSYFVCILGLVWIHLDWAKQFPLRFANWTRITFHQHRCTLIKFYRLPTIFPQTWPTLNRKYKCTFSNRQLFKITFNLFHKFSLSHFNAQNIFNLRSIHVLSTCIYINKCFKSQSSNSSLKSDVSHTH